MDKTKEEWFTDNYQDLNKFLKEGIVSQVYTNKNIQFQGLWLKDDKYFIALDRNSVTIRKGTSTLILQFLYEDFEFTKPNELYLFAKDGYVLRIESDFNMDLTNLK